MIYDPYTNLKISTGKDILGHFNMGKYSTTLIPSFSNSLHEFQFTYQFTIPVLDLGPKTYGFGTRVGVTIGWVTKSLEKLNVIFYPTIVLGDLCMGVGMCVFVYSHICVCVDILIHIELLKTSKSKCEKLRPKIR